MNVGPPPFQPMLYGAGGRLQVSRNSRVSGKLTIHMVKVSSTVRGLELTKEARERIEALRHPLWDEVNALLNAKLTPKRFRRRVTALIHRMNAVVNKARELSHEVLWDDFSRATNIEYSYSARWDDPDGLPF